MIEIKSENFSFRQDGRMNFELRNVNFKLNMIPSSISSFYIEFGVHKILLALFGPIFEMKKNNDSSDFVKTILFESFESNILSKMINFLNKKFDNTSKQKFEHKIKTLISQFDIPIDKINDKDIKYLNKNPAIKLRNIDNKIILNWEKNNIADVNYPKPIIDFKETSKKFILIFKQ